MKGGTPMRPCAAVLLLLSIIAVPVLESPALAAGIGPRDTKPEVWQDRGDHAAGRQGGDTFGTATVITDFPYQDGGATCGYADDYDEVCPYDGSTSPDVVYLLPAENTVSVFSVDLCASSYDTKVYVYRTDTMALVGCNDDAGCGYSGYQSELQVTAEPGISYYIVIDGYGGACGTYDLVIHDILPCVVDCPPGAQQEGEPPCVDGYYDDYNGGCQYDMDWTLIQSQGNNCGTMCARACTFLYEGAQYRDDDYYTLTAEGGPVTVEGIAEFPFQLVLLYVADCSFPQYGVVQAPPCVPASLTHDFPAGTEVWILATPSVFSGVPESDYRLEVCGIAEPAPVPLVARTWGGIKSVFR